MPMFKRVLIILTTGASCLCTYEPSFGEFQAFDSGLSAAVRLSLRVMSGVVVGSTIILWMRQRWAIAVAVAAHGLFAAFWAAVTDRVIHSGTYDGFIGVAALSGLL